jgi:serine protease AprX
MYIDDIVISVATGVEQLVLNNLNLTIAPNPFANETKMSFYLIQPAHVTIDITDVLGRKLKTIANEQMNANVHEFNITNNQSEFQNGIYFLRINIGGVQKVERLIINQ